MNKLKEELRLKMLGQLSNDKTELDINNAYEVCVKFAVLFSKFFAENCFELFDSKTYYIRDHEHYNDAYAIEDIFYLWENRLL